MQYNIVQHNLIHYDIMQCNEVLSKNITTTTATLVVVVYHPYPIFIIFLDPQFFSTQNSINRDKADFSIKQSKLVMVKPILTQDFDVYY